MTQAIVLVVQITAAAGLGPELATHFAEVAESSRKEPGCVNYFLHTDPTDPEKIMLYESFRDQTALDAHVAAPHYQDFLRWRESKSVDPVAGAVVTRWAPVT